jgi:alanine dehydrogenase
VSGIVSGLWLGFLRQLAAVTDTHIRVAASPEEVFEGADILVEASRLTTPEPLLRTVWVKPTMLRYRS